MIGENEHYCRTYVDYEAIVSFCLFFHACDGPHVRDVMRPDRKRKLGKSFQVQRPPSPRRASRISVRGVWWGLYYYDYPLLLTPKKRE